MLEDDVIRQRAYELYTKRGMAEGQAINDWLEAKAELLNGYPTTSRTEPEIKAQK